MSKKDSKAAEKQKRRLFWQKAFDNLEKEITSEASKQWAPLEVEETLKTLQITYNRYENATVELSCEDIGDDQSNQVKNEYALMQKRFMELKLNMRGRMQETTKCDDKAAEPKNVTANEEMEEMTHQQCVITDTWGTFNGEIRKWFDFSNEFKRAVHENEKLDEKDKFAILKKACHEQVKKAVFELDESDYIKAWNKLSLVYGNAYTQIHYWTHSLMRIAPCTEASNESIRQLMKKANVCVNNLSQVLSVEKFEAFLVPILASKMDTETMRIWERHVIVLAKSWAENQTDEEIREAAKFIPTWENLQDFLKSEMDVYVQTDIRSQVQLVTANKLIMPDKFSDSEGAQCMHFEALSIDNVRNNSHKAMAAVMPMNALEDEKKRSAKFLQCSLCINIHPLYKCDVFLQMPLPEKQMHVSLKKLCVRCLRSAHPSSCWNEQSNLPCDKCKPMIEYHNSALCPKSVVNQPADQSQLRGNSHMRSSSGQSDNWD